MGVFIYVDISKSVTEAEWKAVYGETLTLVKAFPFAERRAITYAEKEVICAVRSEECAIKGYYGERVGWIADSDYTTLNGAEDYGVFRDYVKDKDICPEAGDAMLGALSAYMGRYSYKEEKFDRTYSLWGAKTQGEPYHM